MTTWSTIVAGAEHLPAGVWMALAVVNLVATVLTWSVAGRRLRRAGERAADPRLVAGGAARTRDTALTVASLIPAGLLWAMVLAGSLHGLVALGRSVLGWHEGWEYLVPGTLDGVSVTFAFLAFRAVRMKKAPDRCYRVVWGVRVRYGLTAKQLRNVRHAATSGALRQKAIELGVQLPPGYVDTPADDRVTIHDSASAA